MKEEIKGNNKDEVKELLEHIEILDNTDYILHSDKAKALLDYITNLQNENKELKDYLKIMEKGKDNNLNRFLDYKSRLKKIEDNCKKSIETINKKLENNKEPYEVIDGKVICLNEYQVVRLKAIRMKCKELLNILGGDEE